MSEKERLTLRKGEKLRHSRLIDELFSNGNSIYEFPLRLSWRLISPEELEGSFRDGVPPLVDKMQMFISVPKKKQRRAVDRVLLRRRIRESYRLNRLPLKHKLEEMPSCGTLSMAFIYLSPEIFPFDQIEVKMKRILAKLERKITQK